MDTLIKNGDTGGTENGLPQAIEGREELLQRAKICLSVPRGSFLHAAELGSDFYRLPQSSAEAKNALALSMARKALEKQPEISAYSAQVQYSDGGAIDSVRVLLTIYNDREEVVVKL